MNKYIWVVNALYKAGKRGLSLKELSDKWQDTDLSEGKPIARQTFDRWKGGILDTLGIVIDCNLKDGYRYFIYNPQILEHGELSRWLLDTYNTANALSQNKAIKDRILVEDIPSSHEFLSDIMGAMRENRVMDLTYKNFQREKSYTFLVEPYCVKMFQKRWYLVARSVYDNKKRIYGIDRIEDINIKNEHFKMPDDFDAQEYFSTYFGVVHFEDVKVERIVLRADKYHQHYLRTLPLHESQKEIFTCEEYADFELHLRPTYDFCKDLLRVGSQIEVLEPQSLRLEMHRLVRDLWEMYKDL